MRLGFPVRVGAPVALAAIAGIALAGPTAARAAQAKVALVTRDFNNPYWSALRDGAVDEGKKLGIDVNAQAGANETDADGENAKISTLASQNYTCFAVTPVNATNIITPLIPVSRKGTPIINVDTGLDRSAVAAAGLKISAFIGSDNSHAGEIAVQEMLKATGGKGDVVILEGIPGEKNGIARETAFRKATSGKLSVVQAVSADYERDRALTQTEAILKVHPNIDGIFAANDGMGLGAAQAVQNAGKTGKIAIVSIDGIQEALQAVQSGKLTASISQYPYVEGEMAVQACQQLANGKTIPKMVTSPIELITKQNAAQAIKNFPRPFFRFDDPFAK